MAFSSSSAASRDPPPPLRRSSLQKNSDSFRFPPLPLLPRNVEKVSNWLNRKPWIFPFSYCIVFVLILILAIVLAILNVKFWFFFHTIDNRGLKEVPRALLPYFYAFLTLYAILMALTGYVRYRQMDYFLQCAAHKLEDQANSLTFQIQISNSVSMKALSDKIAQYKKCNKKIIKVFLLAALCQLIAAFFCFGPFGFIYGISFVLYFFFIITYTVCMTKLMRFISQEFKYEFFSLATYAITIVGSIFAIGYAAILVITIVFLLVDIASISGLVALFELISSFFFPTFAFITFQRMYEFPVWANVRTF